MIGPEGDEMGMTGEDYVAVFDRQQKQAGRKRPIKNSLTPIVSGSKKIGKFITFDIESNHWIEFVVGGIFDGERFRYFDTAKKLCDALMEYDDVKIYSHFGGGFDHVFLIQEFGLSDAGCRDIIMRGSSIFSMKVGSNVFYDSSGILPFGLRAVTHAYDVKHKKLDFDRVDNQKTLKGAKGRELVKYLEHDCRGLYESIEKFYSQPVLENSNFKPTLASQSIELLRTYLKREIPSINSKSVDAFVREGYAGGRVEIFRPIYEARGSLYYYDFNSLYPAVMRDLDVPGRVRRESKKIDRMGFTDCEVECPADLYLPVLWKKYRGKFYFPRGRFRGVFPGPEIIEAIKQGYKVHRVYRTLEFEGLGPVFRDYIDDLYRMKDEATDPALRMTVKLLLNAGYGRMAINRERDTICFDDGSPGLKPITGLMIGPYRLARKTQFYRGFSNAAIGAMITAYARLKLYRTLRPIQDTIYYCDTDSIITTTELPTGRGLGELKLEDEAKAACFLLPKTYAFGDKVRMKGFSREAAARFDFSDFRTAFEGDTKILRAEVPAKMARILSAKNNGGSILKLLPASTRTIKSRYDKRELILDKKGWNTRPIELKEFGSPL